MEIKRYAKRLFALGTGALMLGATAMGAMAADLKDYPAFFVKDGSFNGYLVVGENAKPIDNLAMTDIAAAMKYKKAAETTTTTVEGDAWLVGTSAKKLEMSNSDSSAGAIIGEQLYDIATFIGKDELKALAGGTYSTGEGTYNYNQYLYFDVGNLAANEIVKFAEDDDDKVSDFFFVQSGKNMTRYLLEFTSPAQSDVTDSAGSASTTGTYLDDFENTKLNFLGKEYTIVMARRSGSTAENSVKLVLMSGSTKDSLLEGEEKTYTVEGKEYKVKLTYTDASYAKFIINGETTDKMQVGETKKLSDGKEIGVSEVLYQGYAGGVHSATFFLGAGKLELKDDNVEINTSDYSVVMSGSEDVDGASVIIIGTDNNATFKINSIQIDMLAQDDYFVPPGSKLSDIIAAVGDEKEVLFTNNWDIQYNGLSTEKTHDIELNSNTDRKYKLVWYDGDGKKVNMPLVYAATSAQIQLSEDSTDKFVHFGPENTSIQKNDYFVITGGTPTSGTAKSYLLQYKGSDKSTASNAKIKFKSVGSGETLEYSIATTAPRATIKMGGYSFRVDNIQATTASDFNISVDLDGDGTVNESILVPIVDEYGAMIQISPQAGLAVGDLADNTTWTPGATFNSTNISISTPYSSDYDDQLPANLTLEIGATTTNEVTLDQFYVNNSYVTNPLLNPSGEENLYYGYTSMGGKLKYYTPSGQPPELTYSYPENQRLPQVYVTSGAITSSSTSEGTWTAVAIVDATKLDSEIADYKAQNLIVVGGPCVNAVAASLLDNPAECASGFTAGVGLVKLFENEDKVAMLVAGYSGEDTRAAGKFVANKWKDLTGKEVNIETASGSITTVAKVETPVVETPAVAETPAATE